MQADEALVRYIATTYYDMTPILGSIKQLPGYDDRNFLLTDSADNKSYVLKIVNRQESIPELADILDEVISGAHEYCQAKAAVTPGHFVVPKPTRTTGNKLSTFTTVRYRKSTPAATSCGGENEPQAAIAARRMTAQTSTGGADDDFEEVKCNIRMCEYFDGTTMFDYIAAGHKQAAMLSREKQASHERSLASLYFRLGKLCNQLFVYLRTQVHLTEKLKAIRSQGAASAWMLGACEKFIRAHLDHLYPLTPDAHPRRVLVERSLDEFLTVTQVKLNELPEFILHSDLNSRNIILSAREQLDKLCLLDFQDLQVGQQIVELSTMALYNILDGEGMPLERALELVPRWTYLGYQSGASCPLNPDDMALAPSLMKLRLCQSLLNGLMAIERDPENLYVLSTNQRGWKLLELMMSNDSSKLLGSWLKA